MATLKNLADKVKGKGRQYKGDLDMKTGNKLKGAVEKLKGKTEETFADIRLRGKK